MRTTIALLLVGLSLAAALPTKPVPEYRVADKAFLAKEKDLLRLFKYIFGPNYYKDQVEIAKTFKIEEHIDWYTEPKIVKEFLYEWKQGFLPKGEVFSVFYEEHQEEMLALFKVFYFAKDWDVFYKTACWAREYVNEGMFVYALQAAVLHRHDTQGMILPPIYEIFPYYFVNSEVIDTAYEYKMKYGAGYKGDVKPLYIPANYSGWYVNTNPLQKEMSYFFEDIGLNAYYYYFNLDYPFWLGGEEFGLEKDRRGELFFWVHQQLLARYYMERLSHDIGSIPVFDWEEPIKTGFVPSLRHHNGLEFPVRPPYVNLMYNPHNQPFTTTGDDSIFDIQEIEDYERRIRDTIDSGVIFTEEGKFVNIYKPEGFEYLGKLIEGSPDSPNTRFYGVLQVIAHQVLGYAPYPEHEYKIVPSAMEHFETCMRDPIFWQFYKRIMYYFYQYKSNLPFYKYSELHFPGIQIEDFHIDKLITYYSKYDWDLSNALYVTEEEFLKDDFKVFARQWRLDHKPFTYKFAVKSDKETDVVVRVFLGPKYDEFGNEIPLNENRVNFIEYDKFIYHLTTGKNTIERSSRTGKTVKDRTTYRELYKHVMMALKGEQEFHLDMTEAHNGFPKRLALPKGKVSGQEFQFFIYISPYSPVAQKHTFDDVVSAGVGSGTRYFDALPFGYPFDRPIQDEQVFFVPNSIMEDVVIYHKPEPELEYVHY